MEMLRFVREAESFPDLPSFRVGILEGLRRLVPCDQVGYNEVDTRAGTSMVVIDPPDALLDTAEDDLARLAGEHPLIVRQLEGDFSTHTISDFLSVREFHRLELYADLYSKLEAEDQIAFGIPGEVVVGIAMNRARRSFSARDRAMLEALRPNLTQAWRHARARERVRALVGALEEGLEALGGAVVMLGPGGSLLDASDAARQLLRAYFGDATRLSRRLRDWIAMGTPAAITAHGPRGRLEISRVRGVDGGLHSALLLKETRLAAPSVAELMTLGLTRREAEVLRLAACGRTNDEIAGDIAVARATVRKHLERIYTKLGVHSRTDAVRRALRTPVAAPG